MASASVSAPPAASISTPLPHPPHDGSCPFCLANVPDQAIVCRGCGATWCRIGEGRSLMIAGTWATLTLLFAIIGIPMIALGLYLNLRAEHLWHRRVA